MYKNFYCVCVCVYVCNIRSANLMLISYFLLMLLQFTYIALCFQICFDTEENFQLNSRFYITTTYYYDTICTFPVVELCIILPLLFHALREESRRNQCVANLNFSFALQLKGYHIIICIYLHLIERICIFYYENINKVMRGVPITLANAFAYQKYILLK